MAAKRFERNTLKLPSSTVHDHLNLIRELRQVFQQLRIHQVRVGNRWPSFLFSETSFCSTALHQNLYLLWMETSLLHCTSGPAHHVAFFARMRTFIVEVSLSPYWQTKVSSSKMWVNCSFKWPAKGHSTTAWHAREKAIEGTKGN